MNAAPQFSRERSALSMQEGEAIIRERNPSAKEELFPRGVPKPAQRALVAAGYTRLDQLIGARESDLAALHGMGPKALTILKAALKERGKSFKA
jgi:hypothetical protein